MPAEITGSSFPRSRLEIFPPADAAAYIHREPGEPRSYPVPVAQSYGFASETLLSRHRRRRTKQAAARWWFAGSSAGEPDLESFSHAHVSARGARGDSNDDRVEIRRE